MSDWDKSYSSSELKEILESISITYRQAFKDIPLEKDEKKFTIFEKSKSDLISILDQYKLLKKQKNSSLSANKLILSIIEATDRNDPYIVENLANLIDVMFGLQSQSVLPVDILAAPEFCKYGDYCYRRNKFHELMHQHKDYFNYGNFAGVIATILSIYNNPNARSSGSSSRSRSRSGSRSHSSDRPRNRSRGGKKRKTKGKRRNARKAKGRHRTVRKR